MPRVHLTDQFCRAATANGKRQVDYFDTHVRRLSLRVSCTGQKVWTFRYRFNKEKRRLTLGPFGDRVGELRLSKARDKALQAAASIVNNIDPARAIAAAKNKRLAREMNTVAHAVDRHVERLRAEGKKDSYLREMKSAFDRHVLPVIGKLPVSDVQPWDIDALLKPLAAQKKNATHNRILAMLSPVFKTAKVSENPCGEIHQLPEEVRSAEVFAPSQLAAIWKALEDPDAGCSSAVVSAIRLGMLTLKRGQEVAGARILEFDLDAGIWIIPGSRMKNGDSVNVPLSTKAREIIRQHIAGTPRANAIASSDALFFSKHQTVPIGRSAMSHAFARAKVVAGLTEHTGTLHCMRHSGITYLADHCGVPPHIHSSLLSHRAANIGAAQATARYLKADYFDVRTSALERWSEIISEALNPSTEG